MPKDLTPEMLNEAVRSWKNSDGETREVAAERLIHLMQACILNLHVRVEQLETPPKAGKRI